MLKNLSLTRPLAVIDLETTGKNPRLDRIVEISILKVFPDGAHEQRTRRLNPGVPIPPDATAVHHITDADVAGERTFSMIARPLLAFLDGCDFCGYNAKFFDLPLLYFEFKRAGIEFPLEGRAVVDPKEIFFTYHPRDLSAAVRQYLCEEHVAAHGAAADALATLRVLDAMLATHDDLPRKVEELHIKFKDPNAVDVDRRFIRVNGEIRVNFGPCHGQPLDVVARENASFLRWMLNGDFRDDAKAIAREALAKAEAVPDASPSPL
jgi:DNA polymerase-3 subunit epsilon